MKTRHVDRRQATAYMKRAEECLSLMHDAAERKLWNACVITAIHSGIAACDAICVSKLGLRNASERHADTLALLSTVSAEEIKMCVKHLSPLLDIKTDAEYGERLSLQKEAETAMQHAGRLFKHAKTIVG